MRSPEALSWGLVPWAGEASPGEAAGGDPRAASQDPASGFASCLPITPMPSPSSPR